MDNIKLLLLLFLYIIIIEILSNISLHIGNFSLIDQKIIRTKMAKLIKSYYIWCHYLKCLIVIKKL